MPEFLAIGFGYSVEPLATRLLGEGWTVRGTTRSAEKAENLRAKGIEPILWSGGEALGEEITETADVMVISVGPDEDGCPAARAVAAIGPKTVVLYLSSSGVYGDHDGDWIDEDTPCQPTSARGERRLKAEAQWRALAAQSGARGHLCRLSGIYGPGRNAIETLRGETRGAKAGLRQRVIKPGQVFNRIHRDDIAAGLFALISATDAPRIINFADNEPSPPQDVISYAAELSGIVPPPDVPFEVAELSPMAREFYRDNKRLRNDRLKALPGFELAYPTYREGLRELSKA